MNSEINGVLLSEALGRINPTLEEQCMAMAQAEIGGATMILEVPVMLGGFIGIMLADLKIPESAVQDRGKDVRLKELIFDIWDGIEEDDATASESLFKTTRGANILFGLFLLALERS